MDSGVFNILAIFNEFILFLMGYQMYLFTDYVSDLEKRYKMGSVFLGLVYFNIGVNFLVLGIDVSSKTFRTLKRKYILVRRRFLVQSKE